MPPVIIIQNRQYLSSSFATDKESLAIYNLKQELMVRSGSQMKEARERNLALRAARKAKRHN